MPRGRPAITVTVTLSSAVCSATDHLVSMDKTLPFWLSDNHHDKITK